jgi:hypothetical protein
LPLHQPLQSSWPLPLEASTAFIVAVGDKLNKSVNNKILNRFYNRHYDQYSP